MWFNPRNKEPEAMFSKKRGHVAKAKAGWSTAKAKAKD